MSDNKPSIGEYIALIVLAAVIIALTLLVLGKVSPASAQGLCPPDAECATVPIVEDVPPMNQEDIPCGELHNICVSKDPLNATIQTPRNERLMNADDKAGSNEPPAGSLPCDDFWNA